jgi:hypothetical protein
MTGRVCARTSSTLPPLLGLTPAGPVASITHAGVRALHWGFSVESRRQGASTANRNRARAWRCCLVRSAVGYTRSRRPSRCRFGRKDCLCSHSIGRTGGLHLFIQPETRPRTDARLRGHDGLRASLQHDRDRPPAMRAPCARPGLALRLHISRARISPTAPAAAQLRVSSNLRARPIYGRTVRARKRRSCRQRGIAHARSCGRGDVPAGNHWGAGAYTRSIARPACASLRGECPHPRPLPLGEGADLPPPSKGGGNLGTGS